MVEKIANCIAFGTTHAISINHNSSILTAYSHRTDRTALKKYEPHAIWRETSKFAIMVYLTEFPIENFTGILAITVHNPKIHRVRRWITDLRTSIGAEHNPLAVR